MHFHIDIASCLVATEGKACGSYLHVPHILIHRLADCDVLFDHKCLIPNHHFDVIVAGSLLGMAFARRRT